MELNGPPGALFLTPFVEAEILHLGALWGSQPLAPELTQGGKKSISNKKGWRR